MPREIPILFSGDMVRAILAGTKTITRRPVRLPRGYSIGRIVGGDEPVEYIVCDEDGDPCDIACPYGKPGDVLWVRETWRRSDSVMHYRASHDKLPSNERWRPSIHMPRWACRLLLRRTEEATIDSPSLITDSEARLEGFLSRRQMIDWWRNQYPDASYCWRIPFVVMRGDI